MLSNVHFYISKFLDHWTEFIQRFRRFYYFEVLIFFILKNEMLILILRSLDDQSPGAKSNLFSLL
jgi:hypothetical protein